ncbi:MAG TPA: L,D-transpeptidase family protein [Deltaproteobacteria bacterium]|nr:L,D-transpeptidase family protein [Deltaproteobacteria bacterium]
MPQKLSRICLVRLTLFALLGLFALYMQGCSVFKSASGGQDRISSQGAAGQIELNRFDLARDVDVIGQLHAVRIAEGDTLADIARHFSLGVNALSAANPGVDVWVPEQGRRIILPLGFVLPDAPRKGIVVNLASMRLFQYGDQNGQMQVMTYPVGIGTIERPTPRGSTRVLRKAFRPTWHVPASIAADHRKKGDPLPGKIPPGPDNPLGEYALYLGKSGYLIHGTNKLASIGLQATNGCLRLYPENIAQLYKDTPVNTPVMIVNQPYLVGKRNGVIYLEAHAPLEDTDKRTAGRFEERLKRIERSTARKLDWGQVRGIQREARGIPVPILDMNRPGVPSAENITELEHPAVLYGKPLPPEWRDDAWYVLAAVVSEEKDARRMAAIINHQGPAIPARVMPKKGGYRVVAGPFDDGDKARTVARRLKIDLNLTGVVFDTAGR